MRTVFYIFALRHRDDNTKFSFGPISRTWGQHATAMKRYKVDGSSKYDRVYDFGCAGLDKTFGIRPPETNAPHSTHKSKAGSHKS